MLNEEKVRTMIQLASYEQNEGKKYLPVSKYYRSDYVGLALIKNFFLVTIGYVLILAVGVGYFAEQLLDNINKINLIGLGIGLIVAYLIILVVYSVITYILYSMKYSQAKKSVRKYYMLLGNLAQDYMGTEVERQPKKKGRRKK